MGHRHNAPCLATTTATINDIPTFIAPARLAKGFRAKAQYHRFLEHKVISLHVPQREEQPRKLARHIVATAKRRAHMVRGHWRQDIHHSGERISVREHQRGDAPVLGSLPMTTRCSIERYTPGTHRAHTAVHTTLRPSIFECVPHPPTNTPRRAQAAA